MSTKPRVAQRLNEVHLLRWSISIIEFILPHRTRRRHMLPSSFIHTYVIHTYIHTYIYIYLFIYLWSQIMSIDLRHDFYSTWILVARVERERRRVSNHYDMWDCVYDFFHALIFYYFFVDSIFLYFSLQLGVEICLYHLHF